MRTVLVATLVLALVPLVTAADTSDPEAPRVDGAVQVTATPAPARAHEGGVVAVHPDDPTTLAVASGDARSNACSLHVSTDAGLTWSPRAAPTPDGAPRCVWNNNGPVVDIAFSEDGTLLYAFSAGSADEHPERRIYVAHSTDLGASFESVREISGLEPDPDSGDLGIHAMPHLAVDPTDAERVYVVWRSNYGVWSLDQEALLPDGVEFADQRPLVAVSEDGGRTFSSPVDAAGDQEISIQSPDAVVDNDGALHVFYGEGKGFGPSEDIPGARLFVATSRDGGATFERQEVHQMPSGVDQSVLNAPRAAVDRGSGTVHVVWEDMGDGPARVLLASSRDGGRTWEEPVQVNDADPPREWLFNEAWPGIAVAPNGRVDIAWYDQRNDPTGTVADQEPRGQDVYYSYSQDGGRTWAPNIKVTDRAIDRTIGPWHTGVRAPVALAATSDVAYLAWSDTRNGDAETMAQDLYATRARFTDGADQALVGAGSDGGNALAWGLVGFGAALGVAGVLLVLVMRRTADRSPQKATGSPQRI